MACAARLFALMDEPARSARTRRTPLMLENARGDVELRGRDLLLHAGDAR